MQIKTSELTGAALDWVVYEAEKQSGRTDIYVRWYSDGRKGTPHDKYGPFKPSTNWSQGGPIIEGEGIRVYPNENETEWLADRPYSQLRDAPYWDGPTPLIAAMRCYVASKLGDVVDIPEELCK